MISRMFWFKFAPSKSLLIKVFKLSGSLAIEEIACLIKEESMLTGKESPKEKVTLLFSS